MDLHAVASSQVSVHKLEVGQIFHSTRHVDPEEDEVAHGRLVTSVANVAQQVAIAHVRKHDARKQVLVEADSDQGEDVDVAELAHAQCFLHELTHFNDKLLLNKSSFYKSILLLCNA